MILLLYLKINKYMKESKNNIIKREKEIQKAIKTLQIYYCSHNGLFECSEYIDNDIQDAFYQGVKWADNNPKSDWINVEDDLPCNHEELIENEYYTKRVLVVLADNYNLSKKHIDICDMCNKIGPFKTDWYWKNIVDYHVVCWKPLPEMPKE